MARTPARHLTLRDVAARLGVSAKTVSNAYRRPDQLSAELRDRILTAAAEVGYPGPNPLAAGLASGRVGAIGVAYANRLSYAFDDPVAHHLLAGMAHVAESARAGLLLLPGSADPQQRVAALNSAVIRRPHRLLPRRRRSSARRHRDPAATSGRRRPAPAR